MAIIYITLAYGIAEKLLHSRPHEKRNMEFSAKAMGEYFGEEPDAYVEKPIEPELLLKTVGEVLAKT